LLLDEPTSQLDPVAADSLIWLLRRLNEEQGIAIVIAEQRLERLLPAADRVVTLRQGRVAFDAAPRGFLEWAAQSAPELQTPAAALMTACGISATPVSVKEARTALAEAGLRPSAGTPPAVNRPKRRRFGIRDSSRTNAPLKMSGVWDERKDGQTILADVHLEAAAGETIALMGRNGAGKSTLLKHAIGLLKPTRGKVTTSGEIAMLTQNPSDHLICERIGDIADAKLLKAAGVEVDLDRHPRDLSGGERQRLAFELVAGSADDRSVLLLDEPTRGLDRQRRLALAERIRAIAASGTAVLLATHDAELAAEVADRIVLLADGTVLADGTPSEILAGGWYFTTETSRILGGAGGALLPIQGAALLVGGSKEGQAGIKR
jgi:energy-coupling factor transport system ATP-binding protein